MLWQIEQNEVSSTKLTKELHNFFVKSWSDFNRCNASLKADFLPIPGSLEISETAFSINFEG